MTVQENTNGSLKFVIYTKITENNDIEQVVEYRDLQGRIDETLRTICRVREKQTRESLIKLGWTPPKT